MRFFLIFAICLLKEGFAAVVDTSATVDARLNEDVELGCQLQEPKSINQITWQKITGSAVNNLATYSEYFGAKVLEPYEQRINISTSSLNVTSIKIKGVRPEDEGCYRCLFSEYPTGSVTGKTCLVVHELYDITTKSSNISATEDTYFLMCSATGKPAPEVFWRTSENKTLTAEEQRTDNGKGSVTVISNLTLKHSDGVYGGVDCIVKHPALQNSESRHFVLLYEKTEPAQKQVSYLVEVVIFSIFGAVVLYCIYRYKTKGKNIHKETMERNQCGPLFSV
ncbi:OX-2 membrane glycoprotein-like [Polypterus senegalus]|uniref:OX-2 membrane glycoprotein-like n=1 Tax=Polypterus senegalus TaxID=55291 RepID=UPI001966927A|nr:OX-2 membrane glycoprotein-like [Polypterus senegalus]